MIEMPRRCIVAACSAIVLLKGLSGLHQKWGCGGVRLRILDHRIPFKFRVVSFDQARTPIFSQQ